jgi:hypothetical protein
MGAVPAGGTDRPISVVLIVFIVFIVFLEILRFSSSIRLCKANRHATLDAAAAAVLAMNPLSNDAGWFCSPT